MVIKNHPSEFLIYDPYNTKNIIFATRLKANSPCRIIETKADINLRKFLGNYQKSSYQQIARRCPYYTLKKNKIEKGWHLCFNDVINCETKNICFS